MNFTLRQDAYAVLLPAFSDLDIKAVAKSFLINGGHSLLLGETRKEYLNRAMSNERICNESDQSFIQIIDWAKKIQPNLNIVVDFEPYGINRLEGKVDLEKKDLNKISDKELYSYYFNQALKAKSLGVSMCLGPIADIVAGENPWLSHRQYNGNTENICKLIDSFVHGVQAAGIHCITKHFPGYDYLTKDPAIEDVILHTSLEQILSQLTPFKVAIKAKTSGMMLGPATVEAFDSIHSASSSPEIVDFLKKTLNYNGLIVSDDLDAPAILRGNDIKDVAVQSLNAGVDLLLLAASNNLDEICEYIIQAVESGILRKERLSEAANKVRNIAL